MRSCPTVGSPSTPSCGPPGPAHGSRARRTPCRAPVATTSRSTTPCCAPRPARCWSPTSAGPGSGTGARCSRWPRSSAALAGLVIDGGVRDREEMGQLGFPVFSRNDTVRGTRKLFRRRLRGRGRGRRGPRAQRRPRGRRRRRRRRAAPRARADDRGHRPTSGSGRGGDHPRRCAPASTTIELYGLGADAVPERSDNPIFAIADRAAALRAAGVDVITLAAGEPEAATSDAVVGPPSPPSRTPPPTTTARRPASPTAGRVASRYPAGLVAPSDVQVAVGTKHALHLVLAALTTPRGRRGGPSAELARPRGECRVGRCRRRQGPGRCRRPRHHRHPAGSADPAHQGVCSSPTRPTRPARCTHPP